MADWVTIRHISILNQRIGLPPGSGLRISLACPLSSQPQYGNFYTQEWSPLSLNSFLAQRTNHTGSDIRITSGAYMNPKHAQRQSVVANCWKWTQIFKCRWKTPEHINPLEARAIMLAMFWKSRRGEMVNRRIFHLTDSDVCQSIFSKGRTSSKMMQPIVKKTNALLLASFLFLYLSHVDSMDNPTDEASRS